MDPKSLSHLDPKMRETYERIMGTATTNAPSTPASPAPAKPETPPPSPAPSAPSAAAAGPSIFSSSPSPSNISAADAALTPPSTPAPDTTQPVSPTPYHVVENVAQPAMQPLPSPASVAQMSKNANSGPLLRILYILGAVIFFVIYTIFWIKIFKLPFFF